MKPFRGPGFSHFCFGNPGIECIFSENPGNETIPGSGIFLFSYENPGFGLYKLFFYPILMIKHLLLLFLNIAPRSSEVNESSHTIYEIDRNILYFYLLIECLTISSITQWYLLFIMSSYCDAMKSMFLISCQRTVVEDGAWNNFSCVFLQSGKIWKWILPQRDP